MVATLESVQVSELADLCSLDTGEDNGFSALLNQLQQQAAGLTCAFIGFCQSVYVAKLKSDRTQWKDARESLGWTSSTATPYAKVGEWLADVPEYNLELLDIKTIMSLCCDKYRPVLEQLQQERLMIQEVRSRMSEINAQLKQEKPPKPVMEWRRAKTGDRSLIIRLEDPEAATELETKFKQSCLPLPSFIRELLKGESVNARPVVEGALVQPPVGNIAKQTIQIGDRIKVIHSDDGWLGCTGEVTNIWNGGCWVLLNDVQQQGLTTKTFFKFHQVAKLE
ncbi:hypothetical protein ACE1AT_04735 [Pelatocladus sp. BLCC-F211]|uniref:hypothetical protein n=1 Tax=Pelatocladus sp. BLCC-F211 TaxID=3342752 RepID=UPI0035B9ABBB